MRVPGQGSSIRSKSTPRSAAAPSTVVTLLIYSRYQDTRTRRMRNATRRARGRAAARAARPAAAPCLDGRSGPGPRAPSSVDSWQPAQLRRQLQCASVRFGLRFGLIDGAGLVARVYRTFVLQMV